MHAICERARARNLSAVVAAYLGIRWYGDTLSAQAPIVAAATGGAGSSSDVMLHLLLALIVVIVMARGLRDEALQKCPGARPCGRYHA